MIILLLPASIIGPVRPYLLDLFQDLLKREAVTIAAVEHLVLPSRLQLLQRPDMGGDQVAHVEPHKSRKS